MKRKGLNAAVVYVDVLFLKPIQRFATSSMTTANREDRRLIEFGVFDIRLWQQGTCGFPLDEQAVDDIFVLRGVFGIGAEFGMTRTTREIGALWCTPGSERYGIPSPSTSR